MSIDQTERFWEWAETELEKRGLTWSTVERQAGLSNATISKRARQLLPPTETTCNGIAKVMNLPPEHVFRIAGLLPPRPAETADREEAIHLFSQLSPAQRRMILAQMRALAAMELEEDETGIRLEPGTAPA